MSENEIVVKEDNAITVGASPLAMMQLATEKGIDLDKVEKLIELQAKWDNMEAEKAYTRDMAEFKKDPPQIFKDKIVSYATTRGQTEYSHATLGNVTNTICVALAEHGFSAEWETDQADNNVKVTCTVTHKLGHSKSTSLKALPDESGGKNKIQAVASTVSYLERYTLLARVGLATHDQDDDGKGADPEIVYIDEKQQNNIVDLIADKEIDEIAFLTWIGCESIEKIPASYYPRAIQGLEKRSKQK